MPVWPICFCSCWPMPALAFIRLPAARTPTSFMLTPASARAPMVASAARSMVSLSGCFPNLVMWIPRIQTSSLAIERSLQGFESEADRFRAAAIGGDGIRRQPQLHAQLHVLRVGGHVDDVAPDAGAVAVDDAGHERYGDAGCRHRHDGEGTQLAGGGDGRLLELR